MNGPNDRPRTCPNCLSVVDAAAAVDGSGAVPAEGDVTVCLYCAQVLIFTADGLRQPTIPEAEQLAGDEDLMRAFDVAWLWRRRRADLN